MDVRSNARAGVLLSYVRIRVYLQRFNAEGQRTGIIRTLAAVSTPLLLTALPITGLVRNPRIGVQRYGDFAVAWQRGRRAYRPLVQGYRRRFGPSGGGRRQRRLDLGRRGRNR